MKEEEAISFRVHTNLQTILVCRIFVLFEIHSAFFFIFSIYSIFVNEKAFIVF